MTNPAPWSRMTRAEIDALDAAKTRHPAGKAVMPRRTVRVPDDMWDTAADCAWDNDETLSDVIRRALDQYIADNQPAPGELAALDARMADNAARLDAAPVVSYPLFRVEQ